MSDKDKNEKSAEMLKELDEELQTEAAHTEDPKGTDVSDIDALGMASDVGIRMTGSGRRYGELLPTYGNIGFDSMFANSSSAYRSVEDMDEDIKKNPAKLTTHIVEEAEFLAKERDEIVAQVNLLKKRIDDVDGAHNYWRRLGDRFGMQIQPVGRTTTRTTSSAHNSPSRHRPVRRTHNPHSNPQPDSTGDGKGSPSRKPGGGGGGSPPRKPGGGGGGGPPHRGGGGGGSPAKRGKPSDSEEDEETDDDDEIHFNRIPGVNPLPLNPQKPKRAKLKASDFLPKPFSGEKDQDPNAFILNFQDYTDLHKLTKDHVILNRFKLCLIGTPRAWLEQANFTTWKDCKPAFIAKYLRLHSRGVAVGVFRCMAMKSEERVSDYVVRLKPIAMFLDYDDNIVRDQLLSALPMACQEAIIMSEGESLEIVIEKADRWFALKKDKTSVGPAVTFPALDGPADNLSRGIMKNTSPSEESDDYKNRYSDRERRDYRSSSRERGRSRDYSRNRDRRDYRDYSRGRDYNRGRSYSRDRARYDRSSSRQRNNYNGRDFYNRDRRSQSRERNRDQNRRESSSDRKRCYFCDGDHGYLFCRQLKNFLSAKDNDTRGNYNQSETRNGNGESKGNNWKPKVRNTGRKNGKSEKSGKSRSDFQ